jgi:hypothetical protein
MHSHLRPIGLRFVGVLALALAVVPLQRAQANKAKAPAAAAAAAGGLQKGTVVKTFAHLQTVLEAGKSIRIVNRYRRCVEKDPKTGETRPGADAIGGMIIDAWEYFGIGVNGNDAPYIIGSRDWLGLIRGTFYREYAKIRFHSDGRVEIVIKWVNAKSGDVTDVHDLTCKIDDGSGTEAVRILVAD